MRFLLIIFILFIGVSTSNPYQTLGVSKKASQQQIKKAFKELSLKWHPDRNKDKAAASKYQQIINAYEILKDSEKRRMYDLTGETNQNNMNNQGSGFRFQNQGFYHQQGNPFGDVQDIFRQFEEQINRQRKAQYERQRRQYQQSQEGENSRYNQDQYIVHQYIDGFGNVRTVLVKKDKKSGDSISDLLEEILIFLVGNPVFLMSIFLIVLMILSSLVGKVQQQNKGK